MDAAASTLSRHQPLMASKHMLYVITCLDPRTDPSAFLELGDAMLIRNVASRVSLTNKAIRPPGSTDQQFSSIVAQAALQIWSAQAGHWPRRQYPADSQEQRRTPGHG